MEFELKNRYKTSELEEFAEKILGISDTIGFKVSSRGWCYILEGYRLINKDQFDKVDWLINNCRRYGYLPIDFVAEESSRQFHGVEAADEGNVVKSFGNYLNGAMSAAEYFTPDWWDGEEYYIQMVVEKIDLVTLFQPVCEEYHIPIANAKGWSSMLQRAEYARRFREAEDKGLECVLLYCGDHDPDGLRISQFIKNNLIDLKDVKWEDGTDGYDPSGLIIKRFGLNYDFIISNGLTWIDNLITGSGRNLASPSHKNHKMPYVQKYLKEIGPRKCEANAIVTQPDAAKDLVREAIEEFLGPDARDRFEVKRQALKDEFDSFLDDNGIRPSINEIFRAINNY
jgi:hypothetical protein